MRGEHQPVPAEPAVATDPDLMGFLVDGLVATYRDAGARLALVEAGRMAAELHDEAAAAGATPAERRAAARALLNRIRQDLAKSARDPVSNKRPA